MKRKSREVRKIGMVTLQAVDGRMVSSGKGKRGILAGENRRLGIPPKNTTFEEAFREEADGRLSQKRIDVSKKRRGSIKREQGTIVCG